mmetsp:Transcript_34565/g.63538  ORF Transcript_34565/g.63538 Transcript_34565/m.63538 type:complete len:492 (+) Transcript_34565:574-2049(+)
MGHAVGHGGVDGVLGNIPQDAFVVVLSVESGRRCRLRRGGILLQETQLPLHLVGGLPRPGDDLAHPPHGLRIARYHRQRAQVVHDILRRDRLRPYPRLGERHVLGNGRIQVMTHHEHVEVLVDGVSRERPGRIRRAGQHVRFGNDLDDVGSVSSSRSLRVVRVDGTIAHGAERVVDVPALVERVRVDGNLHVVRVRERQAGVDGARSSSPVLVQFEPRRAGSQHVLQAGVGVGSVALSGEAEVQRQVVRGAQHHLHVAGAGGAGGGRRARRRSRAAAVHGRDAAGDGVVALLRAYEVNVSVHASGRDDHLLPGDDVRGGTHDHLLPGRERDSVHGIRIARLADVMDLITLDANIGLDHSQLGVDYDGVGDDAVQREGGRDARHLPHALAQALPSAELALLSVASVIGPNPRHEGGVAEADSISRSGSVGVRVGRSRQDVGFALRHLRRRRRIAESALGLHSLLDLVPFGCVGDASRESVAARDVLLAAERD